MADSILKSTIQGRIAAVIVGIGAGYLANRYGYTLGADDQALATGVLSETIGSIGAWVTTSAALFLVGRSKKKDLKTE